MAIHIQHSYPTADCQ